MLKVIIALPVLLFAGDAMAQYAGGTNYTEGGGARTVIQGDLDVVSGGEIDVESGAEFKIGGTNVATQLGNVGRDFFTICGEATTVNNNTVYYGPSTTLTANTANGQACDINATGNATEATADAPIYTNKAVQVLGMTCRNEGDANAAISFTLRTAAGATVPSVTCSIADGERDCVADVQTTTAIAAGATVAVAAASTSDVGDNNGFVCKVDVAY